MVGTKSCGNSNSGRLSEGEYSVPFFSPTNNLVIGLEKMGTITLTMDIVNDSIRGCKCSGSAGTMFANFGIIARWLIADQ